jgi:hypothetical protein
MEFAIYTVKFLKGITHLMMSIYAECALEAAHYAMHLEIVLNAQKATISMRRSAIPLALKKHSSTKTIAQVS